jgi:hypothetical protein
MLFFMLRQGLGTIGGYGRDEFPDNTGEEMS